MPGDRTEWRDVCVVPVRTLEPRAEYVRRTAWANYPSRGTGARLSRVPPVRRGGPRASGAHRRADPRRDATRVGGPVGGCATPHERPMTAQALVMSPSEV